MQSTAGHTPRFSRKGVLCAVLLLGSLAHLVFKSRDHLAFQEIHRRDEWDQMDPAAWSVLSYSLALNQAGRPWFQRWGMPVMNGVVLTFGTKLRWNMKHHETFWIILFQILHFGSFWCIRLYGIPVYRIVLHTQLQEFDPSKIGDWPMKNSRKRVFLEIGYT